MYLRLLVSSGILLTIIFAIFQIIIPLIQNKPLFPFFSKKRKVEDEAVKEQEALDTIEEEKKLGKLKEIHKKENSLKKGKK